MPKGKGGFQIHVKLNGREDLVARLRAIGAGAGSVLQGACRAGGDVILQAAITKAPGTGVVMEDVIEKGNKAVAIGPDNDHWYYKFFETGVEPFEIDMVRRKTKRSAIDRAKSAKKGKTVNVRGRRVQGDTQALKFDGRFAKRIKRGAMPAEPFLRPAFDTKRGAALDAFGDYIRRKAINPNMEAA